MYCEQCNVNFPEGLRYCKWCGGTLEEKERVTSELYVCPACSSQVRQGWVFCKSCGARLEAAPAPRQPGEVYCPRCGNKESSTSYSCGRCGEALQPAAEPAASTDSPRKIVQGGCWQCGEPLEPKSLYCKSCGSAVYAGPTVVEEPALLCSTCKSYSPVGSFNCRVCGAALTAGLGTESAHQQPQDAVQRGSDEPESSTLPDLGEHLAKFRRSPTKDDVQIPLAEIDSGAHTFILSAGEMTGRVERTDDLASTQSDPSTVALDQPEAAAAPPRSRETTAMPSLPAGTVDIGSESAQATTNLKQTRITAPVEGETTTSIDRDDIDQATGRIVADTTGSVSEAAVESFADKPTVVLGAESSTTSSPEAPPNTQDFVAPPAPPSSAPPTPAPPTTAPPSTLPPSPPDEPAFAAPAQMPPAARPPVTPRPQSRPPAAAHPGYSAAAVTPKRPQSRRSPIAMISLGVGTAVILSAAVAAWWYISGGNKSKQAPEPPPQLEAPATGPAKPAPPPEPAAPAGMVKVAGGTVTIGRDAGDPLEQPAHTAQIAPFYIDRTEVTNAEYKKFIDATGHPAPVQWKDGMYPPGEDRLPIVGVTWQDASDYAEWAGKRLPNEEEWETAARGTDARIYPWGNDWRLGAANIGLKPGRIEEVGKYPDSASPSGAMDMIGNVWEWTADEASVYAGSKAKLETEPMVTYRIIRGGAYDGDRRHDASYRGYLDASKPYPRVGFRCVKDAK